MTQHKIEYILFHLGHHFNLTEEIRSFFVFVKDVEKNLTSPSIVFNLSESPFIKEEVKYFDNLPVIFPIQGSRELYTISNGSIIFQHDILKSAFYLLSGYQELHPDYLDKMNRFPHSLSIQSQFGFTGKPIVNYYFKVILEGIRKFCAIHNIDYTEKELFSNFGLFISHDVDVVDTYSIYEVIYKLKQAMGISPGTLSRVRSIGVSFRYLKNYLNIFSKKNPAWTFPFLLETEKNVGFKSTFFMLPKETLHTDAYYRFSDDRILSLLKFLNNNDCEIGLHGTVHSATSEISMKMGYEALKKVSPQAISGIRQHRLTYTLRETSYIHQKQRFMYDTSLGFAEEEGFRNSYCFPFKLYNFSEDRMMDFWELPLNIMDVTLFAYQKYNLNEAKEAIRKIVHEVKEFNGVFSLLWHNNFFDEDQYPGIRNFYIELHDDLAVHHPTSLTGREIIALISHK